MTASMTNAYVLACCDHVTTKPFTARSSPATTPARRSEELRPERDEYCDRERRHDDRGQAHPPLVVGDDCEPSLEQDQVRGLARFVPETRSTAGLSSARSRERRRRPRRTRGTSRRVRRGRERARGRRRAAAAQRYGARRLRRGGCPSREPPPAGLLPHHARPQPRRGACRLATGGSWSGRTMAGSTSKAQIIRTTVAWLSNVVPDAGGEAGTRRASSTSRAGSGGRSGRVVASIAPPTSYPKTATSNAKDARARIPPPARKNT